MKFKKILVVESKKNTKEHLESSKKLKKILDEEKANLEWIFHDCLKKGDVLDKDLVITLGGDGTFVEAGNLIEDSFIIGINSHPNSSEGALTSLSIEEIDELKKILKGEFKILEKQRAKIKLNGRVLDEYAVNEVYIGAENQFHSSRYTLIYRGKKEEQRSSGVIVSTGVGSRAWFKSAGGKEFGHKEEKLSFIVREPYFGKRIYVPTILEGEILKKEKISFESKRNFGGIIAIGFKTYNFNDGDVIEIELAEKPLKVLEKF